MSRGRLTLGLVLAGIFAGGWWAFGQETITLATYYPSPRGVYDELRANRYDSAQEPGKYVLDMEAGILQIAQVGLRDETTRKVYRLSIRTGQLLITDVETTKTFVMLDLNPES